MNVYSKAIETLYSTKDDLLIIGVTGRTGAGCSTVAKILQNEKEKLEFEYPKETEWKAEDKYKFDIIKEYIMQGDRWVPFDVIEVSCIILSYVFAYKYKNQVSTTSLINYLEKEQEKNDKKIFKIDNFNKLKTQIKGLNSICQEIKKYPLEGLDVNKLDDDEVKEYYEFYLKKMPEYKMLVRDILQNYSCYEIEKSKLHDHKQTKYHLYTYLLQKIGNNIRATGNPYETKLNQEEYYALAKRIGLIVEIIRRYKKGKKTRICIDAIRNANESNYLKSQYRGYYLLSISVDEDDRKRRLKNLNANEQESIDNVEYAKKYEPEQFFYHQNIAQCFEMADIHIYNKEVIAQKFFLTWQLIKYITLMIHPGLVTPTSMERCMQLAFNTKYNSGCLSRQVGAVVTGNDFAVKAVGWNDVPKGHMPCNLRDVRTYCKGCVPEFYSEYESENKNFITAMNDINETIVQKGLEEQRFPYCFKDVHNGYTDEKNQVFTRALHAEENAFLQISKYGGQGVQDGYLFCTASPCELCSKKAYQLGIKKIYYIDPYPGIAEKHIIKVGNIQSRPEMNLFYGAIGEAYIALYRPLMPYKDELELISGIDLKKIAKEGKKYSKTEPKTSDLLYNAVTFTLQFISRTEIECYRTVDFTIQNGVFSGLDRRLTWTGSSYNGTELVEGDYEVIEYGDTSSPYRYYINFKEEKKKGDTIKYTVQSKVRDERHLMHEYFSHYVKYPTKKLILEIIMPKNQKFIKNDISLYVYADKEMENPYGYINNNYEIKNVDEEKMIKYYVEVPDPNLFYTYSLEWEFKE